MKLKRERLTAAQGGQIRGHFGMMTPAVMNFW